MKRYCLALDLINDPEKIEAYEKWHSDEHCWPEIKLSILGSGINSMEIYRSGNRLFMVMETADDFSFERKGAMDKTNSKVQAWEELMLRFQQPLPWAAAGEKWVLMDQIFQLSNSI